MDDQITRNVRIAMGVHVGFHAFWVALSLGAVFVPSLIAIPITAFYYSFVLGLFDALFQPNPILTMVLGFPLFAITGAVSGFLMGALETERRQVFVASVASLFVTVLLLFFASIVAILFSH